MPHTRPARPTRSRLAAATAGLAVASTVLMAPSAVAAAAPQASHRITSDGSSPQRLAGDYDGDGRSDIAVWRPSTGEWWVIRSSDGAHTGVRLGQQGDIPIPGDYTGDGRTDYAVWRPSNATWYVRDSHTLQLRPPLQWGEPGDYPFTGDFNGDRTADYAVAYEDASTMSTQVGVLIPGVGSSTHRHGGPRFTPVPGDYDRDTRTDFARFLSWDHGHAWWIERSSDGTSETIQCPPRSGSAIPVVGDFDGDLRSDAVVYVHGTWYVRHSSDNGQTIRNVAWGVWEDIPVAGNYDGDNKSDFVVWHPSSGFRIKHSNGTITRQQWGTTGDIPV